MTTTHTVYVDPSQDLAFINPLVAGEENHYGPLTSMGNDGSGSTLTFTWGAKPAPNAVISAMAGGSVTPGAGSVVCTGTIFVKGALTLCAAIR